MKKQLASVLILSLIIGLVFLIGTQTGKAQTGTQVGGIISTDTTWTQADSPYIFTGNVLVNNGVTLTIQAGAEVNLSNFYILVNGSLQAIGSNSNLITITNGEITFSEYSLDWNYSGGKGCIIQNCNFTSVSLVIKNSLNISNNQFFDSSSTNPNTISYGDIYSTNRISASTLVIDNNIFYGTQLSTAINLCYGTTLIQNNKIINYRMGVNINNGSSTITNNTIDSCKLGINILDLSYCTGCCNISGNLILNNGFSDGLIIGLAASDGGICIGGGAASTYLTNICNNTVSSNTCGLTIDNSLSYLVNNNILGNTVYNVQRIATSASARDINATYSYWGTTDSQIIEQRIFDYYDDFNLGAVTYNPYLNSPAIQAPLYINASTTTGGSINPNGIIRTECNENQTFSITAAQGYHIVDVIVNGKSVGSVNSFIVQNIQEITTISATLNSNPTPTPSPTPSATPTPTEQPTIMPSQSQSSEPSPIPTTPEFSAIVILPLFMAVISIGLILRRGTTKKALM